MFKLQPIFLGVGLAFAASAYAQTGATSGLPFWVRGAAHLDAPAYTGPQSSASPYIVPTAAGWEVTSILSVGDRAQTTPYVMAGIPDGLGAVPGRFTPGGEYVADHSYMTVFMNHEIRPGKGIVRAHGRDGAFVSQWTIHLETMEVKRGEDLIRRVHTWNDGHYLDTTGSTPFNRFCSGDLPLTTAFYNPATGKGFDGLIFMNGEESGNEGRAFAHIASGPEKGSSYELPYLGKFSWENSVAHPNAGDKTIVVGLDDSTPGQVYVYVGDKQLSGSIIEKAGLHGGKLYGIRVVDGGGNYGHGPVAQESGGAVGGPFALVDLSAHATGSGAGLQAASQAAGVTEFARPEDGAWDTKDPKVFYFVTTGATVGGQAQSSRLYKLSFDSLGSPTGGTLELVVDSASLTGTDGEKARFFDNITVDGDGEIIIQEDPGNSAYIAKIWKVNPATRSAQQIFETDRYRFTPGSAGFLTQDEENSGVIDVTDIIANARWAKAGRRYYLGVTQAHYEIPGELVEGGQLYLMASPAR